MTGRIHDFSVYSIIDRTVYTEPVFCAYRYQDKNRENKRPCDGNSFFLNSSKASWTACCTEKNVSDCAVEIEGR